MKKNKIISLVLGATVVAGLGFNVATTANYTESFDRATQTINAATWDVELGDGLGTHTIFPGDIIGNDILTLTNNNDYAVKFTVALATTGDITFGEALTLELLNGEINMGIEKQNGTIDVVVQPKANYVLTSKVIWTPTEVENQDIIHQGQTVNYNYDIVAEALPRIESVVNIANQEELNSALENLESNTLLNIATGNYDMSKVDGGRTGSGFVIDANNVYIMGEEGTVISATSTSANGVSNGISGQNTVHISGNNITLDGLTITAMQGLDGNTNQYNKALEVTANNTFTMKNCTISPSGIEGNNAEGYGGQVSLNMPEGSAETVIIENNTFNGAVLDPRTAITATGNTFNGVSPVHGTALRFRYQNVKSEVNGQVVTINQTYESKVDNNTFSNIEEGQRVLIMKVGNKVIMNENKLPYGDVINYLDIDATSPTNGISYKPGRVILDGVEYIGNEYVEATE